MAGSLPFQVAQNELAFADQLRSSIQHFQLYEKKTSQLKALTRVPLDDLRDIAQAKYDSTEKSPIDEQLGEDGIVKDMLLLELMDWFKNDFFTWMNSPACPKCSRPTERIGTGIPTALERSMSASRVEIYTCPNCCPDRQEIARFPRYNNPVVLLDTRTGRCGEWANCFALICRAAGYEVRHVHDYTDHVWVEIYSSGLKPNRWVHVDPCENSYDNPLLYEVGWGKKLTYIIAVSHDDIQDVTPRYSKDFKSVLSRRRDVNEDWLVSTIIKLRKEMQQGLPEDRKKELQQRWTLEIVELLTPKTATSIKNGEMVGRESGSLAWRLARQELGSGTVSNTQANHVWKIGKDSVLDGKFELNYDADLDSYIPKSKDGGKSVVKGWQNGAFFHEDIFRKEERDWKMVYLATTESSQTKSSKICWKFETDFGYAFEDVQVKIKYSIFQSDAKFVIKVITDDATVKNILETNNGVGDQVYSWSSKNPEEINFKSLLQKSKTFALVCELYSGSGNEGWQKVQLFRQQVTSGKSLSTAANQNILNINFNIAKTTE